MERNERYRRGREAIASHWTRLSEQAIRALGRFWEWLRPLLGEPLAVARPQQEAAAPPPPPHQLQPMTVPFCQAMFLPARDADDEIDLYQLWQVLWGARKFIALFTGTCTLIAVVVTLFVLPVTYKSEAVLVPTDTQGSALGSLASLASSLPLPIALPGGTKSDLILAFLQSHNLQQRLIEKYNLLPHWYDDIWDAKQKKWLISEAARRDLVVRALQKKTLDDYYDVSQDKKSNLITISWVDQDPAFADTMLKGVINELDYYLDHEYETDAMRERQFVQKQLAQATKDLEQWERQIPTVTVTFGDIQRERLVAQTIYAELRKQLELAKISEAKDLIRFRVLDQPYVPVVKFKPKRTLICALTLVVSGMLAVFLTFGYQSFEKRKRKLE